MSRRVLSFLMIGLLLPALAAAQEPAPTPEGWQVRPDRPDASAENIRFITMGDGYHVTLGPAAIFYHPGNTASGEYRVHATFTQTRRTDHPEAYGLFVGGRDLQVEEQDYLYFLVRQDGRFLVKHRAGEETHTLVDWTEHESVERIQSSGRATNTLTIESARDAVRFLVNGIDVAGLDRAPMLNTDGVVGFRVNHNLDLHIAGFEIEPLTGS